MTTSVRRIASSCFVLSVAVAGLALPAPAQAQYVQQRAAEGSHVWGDDGWCYVIQGGRPVRTRYFRVFVPRTNRTVFDIFENGRLLRRVGASPHQAAGNRQAASAEAELQRLIDQLNQQTAAARAEAPRGTTAFCPPMSGPFIVPNVRVGQPPNNACWTPEEWEWDRMIIAGIQTGEAMRRMRIFCENRRADQAYVHGSERMGPDGVMVYRLRDGSEHRRGGTLNPGWMWTQTGPQRTAC